MKVIFCLIGPSASGKSTLIKENKEILNLGEIISTTTRRRRKHEVNGIDYYFVTREDFDDINMIEKDEYAGDMYGTSIESIIEALNNKDGAITALTYEGFQELKKFITRDKSNRFNDVKVISVFVNTPIEELEKRMILRGDTKENIKKRLANVEERKEYDNCKKTDYVFTPTNNDIEETNMNFCELIARLSNNSKFLHHVIVPQQEDYDELKVYHILKEIADAREKYQQIRKETVITREKFNSIVKPFASKYTISLDKAEMIISENISLKKTDNIAIELSKRI